MSDNTVSITIQGVFTSLNEYINAERSSYHAAAKIKRDNTALVEMQVSDFDPLSKTIKPPYIVSLVWYCENQKKDIDNIAFAKKFIFDGLVNSGVIPSDGWKIIREFGGEKFRVDKHSPRVEITFSEAESE